MGRAVGIDLGTTFSTLAVLNEYGKAEIVPNAEGERSTPSVVYFEDKDSVVVGRVAKNAAVSAPYGVVEFIKRQMGNPDYVFLHGEQAYRPEDIAALILKKLAQDAANLLGEPVTDVVITVPAYFDDVRRQATLDAGKIAGLNVIKIINEPTAAALAYGLGGGASDQRIMVYDLGGGTFDVTIMDVSHGEVKVIATDGDHMLGGNDFDDQIMLYVNEIFKAEHGVDLLEDLETQMDLRQRAEVAKKTLSTLTTAKISVGAAGKRSTCEITRDQFEDMCGYLLQRTQLLVESVMETAKVTWQDIDSIFLVGGSTRMPMVSAMLESVSGKKPNQNLNPDEAVAIGAAIQAGIIMAQQGDGRILNTAEGRRLANTQVTDVTSHSFGIIVLDVRTNQLYNEIMIAKNTPIPAQVVDLFYTSVNRQTAAKLIVLQGEDKDPENCVVIGETELVFDNPKRLGYPVEVTYEYDANMMIHAYMEDKKTGRRAELHISQKGRLTDAEVVEKRRLMDTMSVG
ncbi:MAG: Hsp70 family protein [Firmicutes bacterium]|nr:Hsp70 family protein [Bacillota bacterium]